MDVFDFRQQLVSEYERFTRSFTRIRADDIRAFVDKQYGSQRYWPEPLIQVNANFKGGGMVVDLVADGQLSPSCADIFRLGKSVSSPAPTGHDSCRQAVKIVDAGRCCVTGLAVPELLRA